jgi:hypothetical protein
VAYVARKDGVSLEFLDTVEREMPGPGSKPEEQLDYLLPLYRGIQSEMFTAEAKLGFLAEIIIPTMQKIERESGKAEYKASSKKTMGMLVYSPNPIGGKGVKAKARRIRRVAAKYFGCSINEVNHLVEVRRVVTYKVNWQLISIGGGPGLVEAVRAITGMKPRPALTVGKVTRRARLEKPRRKRG